MATNETRWRTLWCRLGAVIFSILLQVVNGYEQTYSISQLSPKSASADESHSDLILQTSQTENLALRLEPSVSNFYEETFPYKSDDNEDNNIVVKRSADIEIRELRSINLEEIPSSNNNEIDSDIELHNKRKYYEIHPTKTSNNFGNHDDIMSSSEGHEDKLTFRFPGEANRVPRAKVLNPLGPIHPTVVQPIFATANHKDEGRQNSDIQNIITGLVKLLNGNVNVQANSQLLNGGRPSRPMNSRINNRGPPRISEVPAMSDLDLPLSLPSHSFLPTKTPPPYPFERPPHHGVNLPDQIVSQLTPPRPGFHRPLPPWSRPRPRPPSKRPIPGLPIYKPTLPPPPFDIPNLDEDNFKRPEEEIAVSENETSHSENNIHPDIDDKESVGIVKLPEEDQEWISYITTPETNITENLESENKFSTFAITNAPLSSSTTTTTTATTSTTTTEKSTEKTTTTTTTNENSTTTDRLKTEKPTKSEKEDKEKKKETLVEKEKPPKNFNKAVEDKYLNITNSVSTGIIQSSMLDFTSSETSAVLSTPLEGLISPSPVQNSFTVTENIVDSTSTNTSPLLSSSSIPYVPYRPRPGIVLDDTDFKPHGTKFRPEASIITTNETRLPGYGEIFDVTVSAIQGLAEKGSSVHIENIHALSGHQHDDIIVSASGDQGFVSIDGKPVHFNLFDSPTAVVTNIKPSQVQIVMQPSVPPLPAPPIGTGIAIPTDVPQAPVRRPTRPTTPFKRPHPTVRIDTCIVGDDSTCDQAQNEKCRTESGISSCQCRPGYARRVHRDPCRRVVSLLLNLRVDRFYDRKVVWDPKLADKESDPYQQLSYEAVRAIDSAFSMTPFSDDFVGGSVNTIHRGDDQNQGVFVNYTVLMQETEETKKSSVAADIQKHILGVMRRRSNNVGASALWVDTPAGSVLPLKDLDECASPDLNDCHQLAICTNTWGGFRCQCPDTTRDQHASSPVLGGRHCEACSNTHCNERGTCRYTNNQPYCSCSSGYYGSTCEVDGEVVGVSVGASLAAALIIALTLAALLSWSRKWSREQKAVGMGSPVFNYMASNTIKTPPVGQPPYQVTLEERMRWAQIAEAMAQSKHYAPDMGQGIVTRPSSAMFGAYPSLPPVPMPRMGTMHGSIHTGTLNTVASRANITGSHHNLYAYTNHMAMESSCSEASSHVQDRDDLLVPRPKSRSRSMQNQNAIYYDVDYENAPEPIYGSKGIPLSTYTVNRGPPYYRT